METSDHYKKRGGRNYVIEREMPNAGKLSALQLKAISQTSCNVLNDLGPEIQWVQSYVSNYKIYGEFKNLT